jgi:Uma2 family endonuclease
MAVPNPKQLLTVEEFHQMAEAGYFLPDERVELIRGEIVEMPPMGSRHIACVVQLIRLLSGLIPRVLLSPQCPLQLPGCETEPQPDLALLWPRDDLASNPPVAADVPLVIEIADSSLSHDRDVKIPLYAESGIPEAWLVDVRRGRGTICVYRRPSPQGYQEVREYRRGDLISPQAFPDVSFPVDSILV